MRLQILCDGEPKLDVEVDKLTLTTRLPQTWVGRHDGDLPDVELTARVSSDPNKPDISGATGTVI